MAVSLQRTESLARLIRIAVRDGAGNPAPMAEIDIAIDGRQSGSILTGSAGVEESSIAIDNPNAYVQLRVTFAGETQSANLPPGNTNYS